MKNEGNSEGKKGVRPGTSKVYQIKWPLSVFRLRAITFLLLVFDTRLQLMQRNQAVTFERLICS